MNVCQTKRLNIRHFEEGDEQFIIQLLNQSSFVENIGDKGVRTKQDALAYLDSGPINSYQTYGYGLNRVELLNCKTPIGMCGLINRKELDDVDIGYALLPEYCGKGYAEEACIGVINDGTNFHNLTKIAAITKTSNASSIALLNKLGFQKEKAITLFDEKNYYFIRNFNELN